MSGGIYGGFEKGSIVITGYQGLAVDAVFTGHPPPGPQHVNVVGVGAFGADALYKLFPIFERPVFFSITLPDILAQLLRFCDSKACTV
jgi:hypothetical protein